MKYLLIIMIAVATTACSPSPEEIAEKNKFFDSCEKSHKPYHECAYLYKAMHSECSAEKAGDAALVGGFIGSALGK